MILAKLEEFLNRFYMRQLVQGLFLFVFFGGLLLLLVSGIEYMLWMDSGVRTVLFWLLLGLEAYFFFRYILLPSLRLVRLRKGISHKEGSRLIGAHFPHVGDRLYNLLDLADQREKSELLLASIAQRSEQLKGIPFKQAVRIQDGLRYARLALIPLVLVAGLWISGKGLDFLQSYKRVVNYRTAYEAPAPFYFELKNDSLRTLENQPYLLKVGTRGEVQPEEVRLVLDGKPLLMEDRVSHFEFQFRPPLESTTFYFEANGIRSQPYELEVVQVPVIDRFEMFLEYPDYLGMSDQSLQGTGNAVIPEGTRIRWEIRGIHTDTVRYKDKDTTVTALRSGDDFTINKRVYRNTEYVISTANREVSRFDELAYRLEVIRDAHPQIKAGVVRDSLNPNLAYFSGEASDDYGLSALQLVCTPLGEAGQAQTISLSGPQGTFHPFYYTFPSGLALQDGMDYSVQFIATDNDAIHGGKQIRSQVFEMRIYNEDELEDRQLKYQESLLEGLNKAGKTQKDLQQELKELQREREEKGQVDFNDQQELKEVLNRQLKQERLMEKFSKELEENLENGREDDPFKELLQERLERQEIEARKNAAIMEELQKVLDKLDQDALRERMDELSSGQEANRRNLEQLLELTKRYYVQEKARQLSNELQKLAERQEVLPGLDKQERDFPQTEQEKLNDRFNELRQELGALDSANRDLNKPLPWQRDTQKESATSRDQREALELLQKANGSETSGQDQETGQSQDAKNKQRSAARKLQELSEALSQGSAGASESTNAEDAEMLRQILDNLVVFSFQQENLFNEVRVLDENALSRSGDIRRQQELKTLFEHVDDSLFALSLRRPEISETINKQISDVYYNIDRGLGSLSENQWYRGASYQQYVITAANELAAMLATILENMQQSMMPGKGEGGGGNFQLPDIIQSQQQLGERMQGKGEQPGGEQSGQQGQQGQGGEQQGQQGQGGQQQGQQGQGQQGQGGQGQGEGGQGNQEGAQGQGDGQQSGGNRQGEGDGTGEGSNGNGTEMGYEELFEIYKEQQAIRQRLEEQLKTLIDNSDRKLAEQIARQMEQFEEELLRNGVTTRTADRINQIQHQLMKLENAAFTQGNKQERESESNREQFVNPITTKPEVFENEQENVEILNRQVLPLRGLYKNKVKAYFQDNDNVPLRSGDSGIQ